MLKCKKEAEYQQLIQQTGKIKKKTLWNMNISHYSSWLDGIQDCNSHLWHDTQGASQGHLKDKRSWRRSWKWIQQHGVNTAPKGRHSHFLSATGGVEEGEEGGGRRLGESSREHLWSSSLLPWKRERRSKNPSSPTVSCVPDYGS